MSTKKQKEYQKQWRLKNPNYNKQYHINRYQKIVETRLNKLEHILEDTNVKWESIPDSNYMISTSGTVVNIHSGIIMKPMPKRESHFTISGLIQKTVATHDGVRFSQPEVLRSLQ